MNGRGDYPDEMGDVILDDVGIEALLQGRAPAADPDLAAVAAFVRDLRGTAARPAPPPSPALAAVLRDGVPGRTDRATVPASRRARRAFGWRRRLAVAGVGTGIALTSVVGAGAAGLLPQPVEEVVGQAVAALTPLELPPRGPDGATVGREPSAGRGTAPSVTGGGPGRSSAPEPSTTGRGPAPSSTAGGDAGTTTTTAPPGGTTSTPPSPGDGPGSTVPGPTVPPVRPPMTPTTLPPVPPLPQPTLPSPGATAPATPPGPPVSLPPTPR